MHHPITSCPWQRQFQMWCLTRSAHVCNSVPRARTQIMHAWISSHLAHCSRRPFSVLRSRRSATTCFVSCVLSYVEKQPALSYKNFPKPHILSVYRSVSLSICLSVCPVYLASIRLSVYLYIYLSLPLSVCLSVVIHRLPHVFVIPLFTTVCKLHIQHTNREQPPNADLVESAVRSNGLDAHTLYNLLL